jgi:uncharacterized protein
LLTALDEWLSPPSTVILTGPAQERAAWQQELAQHYEPRTMVLSLDASDKLPPVLAKPAGPKLEAWVCQGTSCLPPIGDRAELLRALGVKHPE